MGTLILCILLAGNLIELTVRLIEAFAGTKTSEAAEETKRRVEFAVKLLAVLATALCVTAHVGELALHLDGENRSERRLEETRKPESMLRRLDGSGEESSGSRLPNDPRMWLI